MKDEIIGGIRNAIERGSTLEAAVNSFINAGYNPAEVREAASMLATSASVIAQPSHISNTSQSSIQPKQDSPDMQKSQIPALLRNPEDLQAKMNALPKKLNKVFISLLILFLVLIALLIILIIFKDSILEMFFGN